MGALIIGSSPRGRGTPTPLLGRCTLTAPVHPRAGGEHDGPRPSPEHVDPVHPRAGGEHCTRARPVGSSSGSSPRGRGTRRSPHWRLAPGNQRKTGSSPRGRGTLSGIPSPASRSPVHPRAGGEHRRRSDPNARGRRFIPARAGNTRTIAPRVTATTGSSPRGRGTRSLDRCATGWRVPDHPRAGGEHRPLFLGLYGAGLRIIPARAGNTPAAACLGQPVRAGSSPRGRGTQRLSPPGRGWYKSTVHPRAGGEHMQPSAARHPASTVHPRAGGEHDSPTSVVRRLVFGSSPRGRGTPSRSRATRPRCRFIPARAGNTRQREHALTRPRFPVHPRAGGEHECRIARARA